MTTHTRGGSRPSPPSLKVAYFVHDLYDAAVARRIRMLQIGGAEVVLIGFERGSRGAASPPADMIVRLGRTDDNRLGHRALSVLLSAANVVRWCRVLKDCDLLVARSLELLVVASIARLFGCRGKPLVYELLDIHRLMLSSRLPGRLLQGLERRLVERCALVVTSSPAFADRYLRHLQRVDGPIRLIENKPLFTQHSSKRVRIAARPPWRIGWFGMLRCARSLEILSELVSRSEGRVEVVLRGRVARSVIPEFDAVVAKTSGLTFEGAYPPGALDEIYSQVHFAWAIDYFEEGLNSEWLLPNRIYEAGLFGAVPIALASVEVGRWLKANDVGVRLEEGADLIEFFRSLSVDAYEGLASAVEAAPRELFVASERECMSLTAELQDLSA